MERAIGSDASGWKGQLISDWNLGFLVVHESGARFSVSSGLETFAASVDSLADYSGGHELAGLSDKIGKSTGSRVMRSVPSGFPQLEKPDLRPEFFCGPGYFNMDVSLIKGFRLGEPAGSLCALRRTRFYNANFGIQTLI